MLDRCSNTVVGGELLVECLLVSLYQCFFLQPRLAVGCECQVFPPKAEAAAVKVKAEAPVAAGGGGDLMDEEKIPALESSSSSAARHRRRRQLESS